jgi:PEP-CTERM motif
MRRLPVLAALTILRLLVWISDAEAIRIDVVGPGLTDFTGNSSALDERAVLDASVLYWTSAIRTERSFTLTVQTAPIERFLGVGGISAFNQAQIPTAGFITMNPSVSWFVDPTPLDQIEFRPNGDFDHNHRHFVGGPSRAFDLLTVLNHEIGHALGWHADPVGNPQFNPRYVALVDPPPSEFRLGTTAFLRNDGFEVPLAGDGLDPSAQNRVDEMSHTANQGAIPGWKATVMSRSLPLLDGGFTNRILPGNPDIEMFAHAYGDLVAVDGVLIPEPATIVLLGSGAVALGGTAWWRRRRSYRVRQ